MKSESNRLKTFQMNPPWPKDYVDIKKLAKAGFFYAFNGDNVHCAFCRGQVCRWNPDDDPMSEHNRHFGTCPFMMGGEVGNEPLGEDPFPGPKRPRPYDVCGIYNSVTNNSNNPSTQQQIYQGESANQPHSVDIDQYNYSYNNANSSNTPTPSESGSNQSAVSRTQREIVRNQVNDAFHRQAHDESSLSSSLNRVSPLSSGSNTSNCSLTGSSNSLSGICKICYGNSIELVFLPCGHSVSCLSCAQRLDACPCCRATITTRIRTYIV